MVMTILAKVEVEKSSFQKSIWQFFVRMGPVQLKVSSDRLVKPGIEPAIPGLQGKRFIHYTVAALLLTSYCDFYYNTISFKLVSTF